MSAPVDKTCKATKWFTPARVLDPVRHFFSLRPGSGVIDLDPATSLANPVGATCWCISESESAGILPTDCYEDGLSFGWTWEQWIDDDWLRNIFVNPPFGGSLRKWTAKIADAVSDARIVALLPGQRFETAYWQRDIISPRSLCAIVMIRRRLKFLDESGTPRAGNTYGSMLYVYDDGPGAWAHVCQAFGHLGLILRVGERGGSILPERGKAEWLPPTRRAKS